LDGFAVAFLESLNVGARQWRRAQSQSRHPRGSQEAFLRGLAHLYNLGPYQRRAQHAGQCGVEVEGGTVPTHDWFLNLQILTSGGFR
jgi:hypothetical protein